MSATSRGRAVRAVRAALAAQGGEPVAAVDVTDVVDVEPEGFADAQAVDEQQSDQGVQPQRVVARGGEQGAGLVDGKPEGGGGVWATHNGGRDAHPLISGEGPIKTDAVLRVVAGITAVRQPRRAVAPSSRSWSC